MERVKVFQVKDLNALQAALDGLCQFLAEWKVDKEKAFDCKLVATELLGNVLRHGTGKARFRVEISKECVELRVLTQDAFLPPENSVKADVYAEHGRGLYLIDSVCKERVQSKEDGILVRIALQ